MVALAAANVFGRTGTKGRKLFCILLISASGKRKASPGEGLENRQRYGVWCGCRAAFVLQQDLNTQEAHHKPGKAT